MIPLVVLVGATATGKSSLAVDLAEELIACGMPAQIVNADSMCIYRGMDIGTAKATPSDQQRVPHHLIDIMDVTQPASVAAFQTLARQTIARLRSDGIVPILVGGSSLYNRAITDHFDFPGTDPYIRARWQSELDRLGSPALHQVLAQRSPEAAAHILPGNGRRIVRALEVIELTGSFIAQLPEHSYELDDVVQYGLAIEREVMDERIEQRVYQMWQDGLVDEVRSLIGQGLADGPTASKALGYRQILDYLDGQISQDEACELTIRGTRKFARKQLMWFKRDPRITWMRAGKQPGSKAMAHQIARDILSTCAN